MFYIESNSFDPYYNLALEDYLFSHLQPNTSCLFLWQNANTIVVGKNQNALEEINQSFVDHHKIRVARRLSGGGAVYHDLGNLNFTLITDALQFQQFNFEVFVEPIIKTLSDFGITAQFTGRNDLTINDLKFSGNSQYTRNDRLLHHGCIMLDTDLSILSHALNPHKEKFQSKGIKSVISRVTTINQHTKYPISMNKFKGTLKANIFSNVPLEPYFLSEEAILEITTLSQQKYATWEWIYGTFGNYNMWCEKRFTFGSVIALLDVQHSRIKAIRLFGDFFGNGEIHTLEQLLIDCPLDENLKCYLEKCDISYYIHGLTAQDLFELIMY